MNAFKLQKSVQQLHRRVLECFSFLILCQPYIIAHTISYLLLEVLGGSYSYIKKFAI